MWLRPVAVVTLPFALLALSAPSASARPAVGVAWDPLDAAGGSVAAMETTPPWALVGPPLAVGADPVLRAAGRTLYALGRGDGTLTAVDVRCWTASRVYSLGPTSSPEDVAVVGRHAWITRRNATALLRLDLETGEWTEPVDLAALADADGVPDLGTIAAHRGRLFVQVRRLNAEAPEGFARPALVAVVDPARAALLDVDPAAPGVQGIALEGTPPRFRMQIVRRSSRLYVSATGGFFDAGGIEAVDLRVFRSAGLVVAEADGHVGADLGAFVFTRADGGYLTFSTDLLLSSHLNPFTIGGAVGPELHVALDYFVPALVFDARGRLVFVPDGTFGRTGVDVFDARSGARLTPAPTRVGGAPTDLALLSRTPKPCR